MRREPPLGLTLSRRRLLRWGTLVPLGLTAGMLDHLRSQAAAEGQGAKHRQNACVFLFLFGGPSQIDLWDMKPHAPVEIRGQFRPVATRVPGIRICEHLPRLARVMDRLCLIRSMTHRMNVHGPAISEVMTGRPYPFPPTTDQERPEDWPSLAALVTRFGSGRHGLPPAAVLPWYLQFPGQPRRIAGQRGGRMGRTFDPLLLPLEPDQQDQTARAFRLPAHLSAEQLRRRRELLQQLDSPRPALAPYAPVRTWHQFQQQALELLEHRAIACYCSFPDRRIIGIETDGDLLTLANRLRKLVALYAEYHPIHRLASEELEQIIEHQRPQTIVIVFPTFTPEEIVTIVQRGCCLPTGITRHLITGRALNLNFPLEILKTPSSLEEKNRWLDQWLTKKILNNKVRFYPESVFVFDE